MYPMHFCSNVIRERMPSPVLFQRQTLELLPPPRQMKSLWRPLWLSQREIWLCSERAWRNRGTSQLWALSTGTSLYSNNKQRGSARCVLSETLHELANQWNSGQYLPLKSNFCTWSYPWSVWVIVWAIQYLLTKEDLFSSLWLLSGYLDYNLSDNTIHLCFNADWNTIVHNGGGDPSQSPLYVTERDPSSSLRVFTCFMEELITSRVCGWWSCVESHSCPTPLRGSTRTTELYFTLYSSYHSPYVGQWTWELFLFTMTSL